MLWSVLAESLPDLAKMNTICNAAVNLKEDTHQHYHSLLNINNACFELKVLMGVYARHIVFDEALERDIQNDIKQMLQMEIGNSLQQDFTLLTQIYNIFDPNTGTLTISTSLDKLG